MKLLKLGYLAILISIIGLCAMSVALAAPQVPSSVEPSRVAEQLQPTEVVPTVDIPQIIPQEPIVKAPQAPKKEIKFYIHQVTLEGVTVYSKAQLAPLYQQYLGKEVTLTTLRQIADKITYQYRKDGYIISRTIIPKQKVKTGVVRIQVIEGYVDTVTIEGKTRFAEKTLEAYGEKIKKSRPLNSKVLERYVLLANDLPGVSARVVIAPSATKVGAADVKLIVEQKYWDADLSFNNYGTRYLGPNQMIANVHANSIFGTADQIGINAAATPGKNEMKFGELAYQLPLGSSGLSLNADLSRTETQPRFLWYSSDIKGTSTSWDVKLNYPIIRLREQSLYADTGFKWLDSDSTSSNASLYRDYIRSIHLGLTYVLSDKLRGFNVLTGRVVKGLPVFGASPSNPVTPLTRDGGESKFIKYDIYLSRTQVINRLFSVLVAANGQYTNNSLLSAEEFGLGGRMFGCGYDPSEIVGDRGIAGKAELRFNVPINAYNVFPSTKLAPTIQCYAFYHIGKVWNVSPIDQVTKDSLASTGLGLRVNFGSNVSANVELDKPLTHQVQSMVAAGNNGRAMRCFFNLMLKS